MTETEQLAAADLTDRLNDLKGLPCWGFSAGPNTGSDVDFHFGEKLLRDQAQGERLAGRPATYDGERNLWIFCAWRLDSDMAVVCGSDDDNSVDGPMIRGLRNIENAEVVAVEVRPPAFDLDIRFSNGLILHVFCDGTGSWDDSSNYGIYWEGQGVIVGPRGQLRRASGGTVA